MENPSSKLNQENIQTYFPFFNQTLFVNQETELNLSNESSTNISQESSNNSSEIEEKLIPLNLLDLPPLDTPYLETEKIDENKNESENEKNMIKPELKKYTLSKELFINSNNKNKNKIIEIDKIKKNLDAKPYIPIKFQLNHFLTPVYNSIFLNRQKNHLFNYKPKKEIKERKGDWLCIKCNNLNFSFRKKCNMCGTDKCSEVKLFEIGGDLLELANISVKN